MVADGDEERGARPLPPRADNGEAAAGVAMAPLPPPPPATDAGGGSGGEVPPPGAPPAPPTLPAEWVLPPRPAAPTVDPVDVAAAIAAYGAAATSARSPDGQVRPMSIGSASTGLDSASPADEPHPARWAGVAEEEVRLLPPPVFDDEDAMSPPPAAPAVAPGAPPYLLGQSFEVVAPDADGELEEQDVVVFCPPYFDGSAADAALGAGDGRAAAPPGPWASGPIRSGVRRVWEAPPLPPARNAQRRSPVGVGELAAASAAPLPATPSASTGRLGGRHALLPPPWTSAESVYSTASESAAPVVRRTAGRADESPSGSPVPGGSFCSDFGDSSGGGSRVALVGSTDGLGHVDSVASSTDESDGAAGATLASRYKAAVLDAEELAADARAAETEAELDKAKASLRENLYVLAVILFFAISSLSAIFINKSCLSGYGFNFPFTLLMGQMLFSLLTLSLLDLLGPTRLPLLTRSQQLRVLLPTLLFIANVVVGLSALSLVNIPMFSAFRRLTLLFVMGAEYLMLGKRYSRALITAVVTMAVGAFVSALDDGTFSSLGYALVFINNVLTAAYLASIKRVMVDIEMSPLVLLYYTALLGLPFIAILLPLSGELHNVVEAFTTRAELWSFGFGVSVLLMAASAFLVYVGGDTCGVGGCPPVRSCGCIFCERVPILVPSYRRVVGCFFVRRVRLSIGTDVYNSWLRLHSFVPDCLFLLASLCNRIPSAPLCISRHHSNFSTSLCTDITTPLTTSVAGQVKNVLQTVLGFFSWGYVFSPLNAVGLVLALMGQCWFAWIKYSERHLPADPVLSGAPVRSGDGAVATTSARALLLSEEDGVALPSPPPQGHAAAAAIAV